MGMVGGGGMGQATKTTAFVELYDGDRMVDTWTGFIPGTMSLDYIRFKAELLVNESDQSGDRVEITYMGEVHKYLVADNQDGSIFLTEWKGYW